MPEAGSVPVSEGKDHMQAISDERLCPDILKYIANG